MSQALLTTCFMLVSCLAYSSTLKIEATCSPETLVDFQCITQRYIPECITFHNYVNVDCQFVSWFVK
jgi:hypothetical protein